MRYALVQQQHQPPASTPSVSIPSPAPAVTNHHAHDKYDNLPLVESGQNWGSSEQLRLLRCLYRTNPLSVPTADKQRDGAWRTVEALFNHSLQKPRTLTAIKKRANELLMWYDARDVSFTQARQYLQV